MQQRGLIQDVSGFYNNVAEHNKLTAEHLLSILGPLNAKLENPVTLVEVI